MNLASEITITIGPENITLRPTLRRALRLASRDGSFSKIITEIEDGSLTATLTVIADNYPNDDLAEKLMRAGTDRSKEPLLSYVLECAGLNPDLDEKVSVAESTASKAKTVSFEEHLTGLFRIATGWIGWTPQQAWDASPAEIIEAYKGRVDLLKAIFGGADDELAKPVDTNERFKTVFQSFGTVKVERNK